MGQDKSGVAEGFAPLFESGTGTGIRTQGEEVADFLGREKCVKSSILARPVDKLLFGKGGLTHGWKGSCVRSYKKQGGRMPP